MPRRKRTQGHPARKGAWQPLQQAEAINPVLIDALRQSGAHDERQQIEVWANDRYEVIVRRDPAGIAHLSIKRRDRAAVRDWRHLQQIKNEVLGPEIEACEVFPAESRLVDTANEYHLWALPPGQQFPWTGNVRAVAGPDEARAHNEQLAQTYGTRGKGRQRPWEPGLTTGSEPTPTDSVGITKVRGG